MKYHFTVDNVQECERLEQICLDHDGTRVNQEDWTTDYGGTGISLWVELEMSKRDMRQIVACFDTVQIVSAKK